jgi:hypothetical protein
MKPRLIHVFIASIFIFIAPAGCGDDSDGPDAAVQLQWYATCGDPVCAGYTADPNDVVCTTQTAGATCAVASEDCAIANDGCNIHLLCADSDPAVNCPISLSRFKRDIRYLSADQRDDILRHLVATRLATYHYRGEADTAPPRLGFLIDDQPQSQAVLPSGERVDLYGYTSMAVAGIQAQAAQIQALEQEIARLRQQVEALTRARR